ncbi:MAG: hypothetical protein NC826_05995, partial [Candidatus Omnitrophica bacterium]|nr:hypothetical protein [Candidatus Omnitrophota bacterium]
MAYLAYFGAVGWIFGCGMAYLATDYGTAKLWLKLVFVSIILIAPTFFHFVSIFLEIKDKEKKFILINYLISFLFIGFTIFSDLLIYPAKHWWGYYPKAGSLIHPIFLLWFGFIYYRGLYNLFSIIRQKAIPPLKKLQSRYLFWAYVFAIIGGIDFIPDYGVEFFPFGFLFTGFGATIITYAIVKHHLLDINIVLTRAGIFALVYFPIVFIPFWIASKLIHTSLWWFPMLLFGILTALGIFIFNTLRKRAEDLLLKEQRRYQRALRQAAKQMTRIKDLDKLCQAIVL